jgi:hypothetical protein
LEQQAEQDVLGADVVVVERLRFAVCRLEGVLDLRREGEVAGGHLVAFPGYAKYLVTHFGKRDPEGGEEASREAVLLAQQSEQDVFAADLSVFEGSGLVLR